MTKVQIEKGDLQSRDRKISRQQEEIAELQEKLNSIIDGSANTNSFGSEDKELLGELHEPIQKLITSALGGFSSKMEKNFDGLTKSLGSLEKNIQSQNKSLFSGVASTTLKNYSDVKDTAEFKEFLESNIKGVGVSWGDSLASAEKNNNITLMQEIVDEYLSRNSDQTQEKTEAKSEAETKKDVDMNFEPSSAVSTQDLNAKQYLFKETDLGNAYKAYNRGDIKIEELEQFEEAFQEASLKGQVFNDAEGEQSAAVN